MAQHKDEVSIIFHELSQLIITTKHGNSRVVQWIGLCAFTVWGSGSIPGLRTKILHVARPKKEKKRKEKFMAYKNKTSVLHLERTESYKKYF